MLASIVYTTGFIYTVLGVSAFLINVRGSINRLFSLLMGILATWSFTYSISLAAGTAEESITWRCLSVFGWGIFYSVFLHLSLALIKSRLLNKRITYVLIYLPALINVILYAPFGFLGPAQYEMTRGEFGWINISAINIGGYLLNLYYLTFGLASVILFLRWLGTLQSKPFFNKLALKFKLSFLFSIFVGVMTDILPDILGIKLFPKIAIVSYVLPAVAMYVSLRRFGLFSESAKEIPAFSEYSKLLISNRVLLFRVVGYVLVSGGAISFLIRYFYVGGSLKSEVILFLALVFMGFLAMITPKVIKEPSMQNTVFLLISLACSSYFSLSNIDEGGITVWVINLLFFFLTIVLGGKIQALIFAAISIASQILLLIVRPEIVITVNRADYITRIAIIALFYAIANFLINLQEGMIRKHEKSALEQNVLEHISSSFISINKENTRAKVDDMFRHSAKILDFDFAYLLEVLPEREEVSILNSYAKSGADEGSYPHKPGCKISADISLIVEKAISDKNPVLLEDIASISIREHESARSYFMSKGVNSFAALPVIVDGEVHSILVVEYRERANAGVWEHRMYILRLLVTVLIDARKKLLYEKRLHESAYFDEVTKMPNLNMLRKTLESMLNSERESREIALLDIEIENLQMIYDTFGRDVYIQITKKSASILENLFENCIIIAKTGDEEFIVVLPHCGNDEEIAKWAREVVKAFSDPILIEAGIEELFAIVNVGIALYPKDGKTVNILLESAELAGYEAEKSDSKIAFYAPHIKDYITETALLTNRLFKALKNNEFYLKFQPQVNCISGKTSGLETLLRLKGEDERVVGPGRFVPILENTGLIYEVGRWVLMESIATHQRLIRNGFPPLRFSVNVSVLQFKRHDFVDSVAKILAESLIDPQYIELELTESSLSDNLMETVEEILELKELGVSVAIDDFGKGYSSLNRLEAIPFDRIKIDKSIINNITLNPKRSVVVKMIISLAEALKTRTIVEGIETKEQCDLMKELGCTEIQGFYYSKPLDIDELEEFLRKEMQ